MIKINLIGSLTCLLLLAPIVGNTQTCNNAIIAKTPTAQFIDNKDGTITDNKTGLMWKRCSQGQSWNENSCEDSASGYNWGSALSQAENSSFAEHSDWRLPNMKELQSLVETRCYAPAINLEVFPETPSSVVWSSSPVASNAYNAWMVNFGNGYGHWHGKHNGKHVRLVRSGQ